MKAPAAPACTPVRWFLRRCVERVVGGLLMVLLWPLFGLRAVVQIWFSVFCPPARGPSSISELSLKREPVKRHVLPVPEFVPTLAAGLPPVVSGPLDRALGGGFPMARTSVFSPSPGAKGKRPRKQALYDTELVGPMDKVFGGMTRTSVAFSPGLGTLKLLVVTRIKPAGEKTSTGHCGTVLARAGFEGDIQKKWGGGTYEVHGIYEGRKCVKSVEIGGASKPINHVPQEAL